MVDARVDLPSWDEMAPWFERFASDRDPEVRARIIVAYLPLAHRLARRYRSQAAAQEELEQVACVGLILAVDRFDPARETPFPGFATVTILGELRRHFRDKGWAVRPPRRLQDLSRRLRTAGQDLAQELGREPTVAELAERLEVGVDDVVAASDAALAYRCTSLDAPLRGQEPGFTLGAVVTDERDGAERFALVEDLVTLRAYLQRLPPREQRILELRFVRGWTQKRIAAELGISQMQVSRLLTKTLDRLHERMVGPTADAATNAA